MSILVVRQPIFDKKLNLYGYELAVSGFPSPVSGKSDQNKALRFLDDGMNYFEMEQLAQGKPVFVQLSSELLVSDRLDVLRKSKTVFEVQDKVEPGAEVVQSYKRLKKLGYIIALDNFVYHPSLDPRILLADIIKVDVRGQAALAGAKVASKFGMSTHLLMASNVDDYAKYRQSLDLGFSLFQGQFYCELQDGANGEVKENKIVAFELLKELQNQLVGAERLEQIIQKDIVLSFKVIQYVNSAAFGFKTTIESLRQAISLLGNQRIITLATLTLFQVIGKYKPGELFTTALVRGRFAERVATRIGLGDKASRVFLVGMFSLLDALLDRPMTDILRELNLHEEMVSALLRQPGSLTPALEMVVAFEQADWEKFGFFRRGYGLEEEVVQQLYFDALAWAGTISR